MLYAFSLLFVIFLGVLGFLSVAISPKTKENKSTVSVEYEIIEDNE